MIQLVFLRLTRKHGNLKYLSAEHNWIDGSSSVRRNFYGFVLIIEVLNYFYKKFVIVIKFPWNEK